MKEFEFLSDVASSITPTQSERPGPTEQQSNRLFSSEAQTRLKEQRLLPPMSKLVSRRSNSNQRSKMTRSTSQNSAQSRQHQRQSSHKIIFNNI